MILFIWFIAFTATIPWALFFKLVPLAPETPDILLCMEDWPRGTDSSLYFLVANLIACYLVPMALISICYILIWVKVKTKKKSIKLNTNQLLINFFFFLLFQIKKVWRRSIPGDSKDAQMDRMQQKSKIKVVKMLVAVVILFILSWLPLYAIFARLKFGGPLSMREDELIQLITPIAQWLGSSNSCINPILYAFFNRKYRKGFAAIIRSRKCCGRLRYYENVAIASSSTSTRKSSHYHNNQSSSRKPPYSPPIKSDAVSYIYDSSTRKHNIIAKQDSSLSRQMLLKQDSNVSRQSLVKQDSTASRQALIKQDSGSSISRQDSSNSRQALFKQDSNGSRHVLSKQDSQISYIESKKGQLMRQDSDLSKRDYFSKQDSIISYIEPARRGILCKQDTQISYIESKKNSLSSQDSVVSFMENKKNQLTKQDSVISFADQRPGKINMKLK